ncbi:hypothetical protein FACS1894139_11230 [Planctomycetales bacterium]|nr:hypothetical protein FACS1894107_09820 [Planctomycetales bacterium]GHS98351.1 hypothetical protein FACS1894108_06350 [Planctomycetales bacterium]GHT06117.1 hypothetical protein FACS1894139_11230 [Planctomycetales bacterium]
MNKPYRRYWNFYYPLLLTSVVMQSEPFFQNRALAQYSADGLQLAIFANAGSCYQAICALLIFVPQVVTMMATNPAAARRCQIFTLAVGAALALPLFFIAYTLPGEKVMSALLAVPLSLMDDVQAYLKWLAPMVIIEAQIFHNTGRLIAAGRTAVITRLNFLHLIVIVALLHLGVWLRWEAVFTLATATLSANLLHLLLMQFAARRAVNRHWHADLEPATYRQLWAFYWPMAITGVMFALSRPIIYRYVNFLPPEQAIGLLAALRVAFDAGFFFQAPVNQMRNLFTSFPAAEQSAIRRFSFWVSGAFCAAIMLAAFTPLGEYFFRDALGLTGKVKEMTAAAFMVLSLNPLIIAFRNIYHGELMNRRQTGGMAVGALARTGVIWVLSLFTYQMGWLNHWTGAGLMLSGFIIEAVTAYWSVRRLRRREAVGSEEQLKIDN